MPLLWPVDDPLGLVLSTGDFPLSLKKGGKAQAPSSVPKTETVRTQRQRAGRGDDQAAPRDTSQLYNYLHNCCSKRK